MFYLSRNKTSASGNVQESWDGKCFISVVTGHLPVEMYRSPGTVSVLSQYAKKYQQYHLHMFRANKKNNVNFSFNTVA